MADGYRLLTYRGSDGQIHAGVLVGERVHDAAPLLAGVADASSVIGILRAWDKAHPQLHAAAAKLGSAGAALDSVELLAPILYPGALFCAGANYWDHLEEMAEIAKRTTGKAPTMTKGAEPWFFMKTTAGSIIGAHSEILQAGRLGGRAWCGDCAANAQHFGRAGLRRGGRLRDRQ
jgi:2-keto-4-pentenoate hydratase/2-oxohepta-3-ene-1,7-dioic acid hydratase in catechol pathway